MKPPAFSYHDPETLGEAIALLHELENAKVLAGGQSLMPMMNMRYVLPDHVIDLGRIPDLAFIREKTEAIEIGAMTRQRTIERDPIVQRRLPLLHEAILQVGHLQTRNRGTIGGSLCHLDPAAEMVTVAQALDAEISIAGPNGVRRVAFRDFPTGYMQSTVERDEILVAVRLSCWASGHGHAFVEFARRHGDFAIVSAACLIEAAPHGRVGRAALAIGGIGPAPIRMEAIERVLVGELPSGSTIVELAESCRHLEAIGDALVPATYRRHLAAVMAKRAMEQACTRAGLRRAIGNG